ncbi:MAG: YhbY family RNA-binding protein [Candidatus Nanoarchaeia archaeon]|jgi:RNA-binding protein YhbY|nr:YhbY family RNA-binding protein [Candidatus Nanoarchaeia archaeon]MDD3994065.1 YhbY family RNA-binding protein [Candidatus Nanoarchaeia archaeon]MDD4563688.1 YhbY family RNA-binding protein [Candidatus Nanoarchaeia archaeon]
MVKPVKKIQLGKKGITPEFIDQIKTIFQKQKILRINLLKSACRDKEQKIEFAEEIVKNLGSNYKYKIIGYVIVILKFRK